MTAQNYAELCDLQKQYADKGLRVLAFPCNQFGGQEPGTPAEIESFVEGKCPNASGIRLMGKVDVNGDGADPLFTWLKEQQKSFPINDIPWNFGKFLVDKSGKPVGRFGPPSSPKSIEDDIVKLLNA